MNKNLEKCTDNELIGFYLEDANQKAFEVLLRRYYGFVFKRFASYVGQADAEDLVQQLWIRVLDHLDGYRDEGKFSAFLSTIARNLLNDYWRRAGVRNQVNVDWEEDDSERNLEFSTKEGSTEDQVINQEAVSYLTTTLIPTLPCEQRMIYLLRHESEHWEEKQRLEWHHLAELNGVDVDTAWNRFESARGKMVRGSVGKQSKARIDEEELLVFVVWTQAQRPDKSQKFTESYFADLLDVPVNTLKTRYKSAGKNLADGMNEWRAQQ